MVSSYPEPCPVKRARPRAGHPDVAVAPTKVGATAVPDWLTVRPGASVRHRARPSDQ